METIIKQIREVTISSSDKSKLAELAEQNMLLTDIFIACLCIMVLILLLVLYLSYKQIKYYKYITEMLPEEIRARINNIYKH